MKDIRRILYENFDLSIFVPEDITGFSQLVGQNKNLCVSISAPGHIDPEKWIARFHTMTFHPTQDGGCYFQSRHFFEIRASSKDHLVYWLTNCREGIYKHLFNYVSDEYRKIVPLNVLRENDPHTYEQFKEVLK